MSICERASERESDKRGGKVFKTEKVASLRV